MKTFAGIPQTISTFECASIILQSIPYDGTSTWGKGADKGFGAFLEASHHMELYDIETDSEVFHKGIHLPEAWDDFSSPEDMFESIYQRTTNLLTEGKFPTFFGGEHSISIGVIKAFYEKYEDLTVLHLDAHADLRPEYDGTPYNHACAVFDASKNSNLIQVGIRSMDQSEKEFMDFDKVFFAYEIKSSSSWIEQSIALMGQNVYITLDLDVFDPAIMPATGTPEPNGLSWHDVVCLLRKVFRLRNVVGFDIVELAPIDTLHAPQFLAAKLYYKMLSYKFENE